MSGHDNTSAISPLPRPQNTIFPRIPKIKRPTRILSNHFSPIYRDDNTASSLHHTPKTRNNKMSTPKTKHLSPPTPKRNRYSTPTPKAERHLLSTPKTKHYPRSPNTELTAFMVTIGSRYNPSAREIVSPGPARSKASVSDMGFPSGSTWYTVPLPDVDGVGIIEMGEGVGDGPSEEEPGRRMRRPARQRGGMSEHG